jgi:hypothetical protein
MRSLNPVLLLLIITVSTAPLCAEPQLTIPEAAFDFGYVPQNAVISHVFWLHSTGTDTLKITEVRPGCGCTKAPLEKTDLAVGDSTRLEIIYSTRTYRGLQSKRPSIESNEGARSKSIQFKANVYANPDSTYPLLIKPHKWDISRYGEKERAELGFEITNISQNDLEISLIDSPAGMFKINIPRKLKAGKTEKGTISLKAEFVDKEFEKSITLELNDASKTRFTIPVQRKIRIPGQAQTQ